MAGDVVSADTLKALQRGQLAMHQEIAALRARLAQVEQMARPGGPARVGRPAPSPAAWPSEKEREYLAKAASVDDDTLAQGYRQLAEQERQQRLGKVAR